MTIREKIERMEQETLSPYATLSIHTKGREREEEPCDIRPVFQRDRDRILHSKAIRPLKNKTQVFLTPKGDHYRTRLSHTLEVSQNARTIAKALRLNEDLVEAIALGHDLGHTPFGHAGEYVLDSLCEDGFRHNEQSVRIVEKLEKNGEGLNLTWEVKDGILNHQTRTTPHTLEGRIVRLSDKIAYINHDIDDAIRGRIFREQDIPERYTRLLGHSVRERLNIMIHDIIENSMDMPKICMSPGMQEAMQGLRSWLFENMYLNEVPKAEERKAQQLIASLYRYYLEYADRMPEEYRMMVEEKGEKKERVVCDYIAGMSDSYAIYKFEKLFVPEAWKV